MYYTVLYQKSVLTGGRLKTAPLIVPNGYENLIIIFLQLEVGLRMIANRADIRRAGRQHDMTAIAALPGLAFIPGKNFAFLDIL